MVIVQPRGGRAEKGAAGFDARRRNALAKLGIAAVVAYTAPMIIHVDRAQAGHQSPGSVFCLANPNHPQCQ